MLRLEKLLKHLLLMPLRMKRKKLLLSLRSQLKRNL